MNSLVNAALTASKRQELESITHVNHNGKRVLNKDIVMKLDDRSYFVQADGSWRRVRA